MKAKRFFYSVLLALFSLVLLADLGMWFFVPEAEPVSEKGPGVSSPRLEGLTSSGDGSLPQGMAFPGSDEGSGDAARRRSRRPSAGSEAQAAEAGETMAETFTLPDLPAVLTPLLPLLQIVRPYRLHILIGSILGIGLCILRLVSLQKRIRQQREKEEAEPVSLRRVALWPAFALLLGALVLVVFLFPVNEEEAAEDGAVANVRLLTGTVAAKDLTSLIQSAGSLAEQEALTLTFPVSLSISSVCVKNGDHVTAGQIVAKADEPSLMQAIASVHEALAEIDSQLQKAHEAKGDTALTAPVEGTVKAVYARAGETVIDVMNEHGALMLLSLDGRMAVHIPAADELFMGSAAVVTLSDGTELAGEVTFLEEGVATVTMVDRGYAIGTQVSVKTKDGKLLGSGPLYVHKALNITGYLGTVSRVYRSEGSTVYAGAPLIGLHDTADLAQYQALLQQRAEYEAELKTLFELYQTGYIHAPCDGVIGGLSEDLSYVSLADMAAGLTARHLSAGPSDGDSTEYIHYIGQVLENAGGLLSLNVGAQAVTVDSYTPLPALPAATMTGTYTIPGSSPIYLFSGGWNTITAADILVGDKLLFTFDESGRLVWVIAEHTADSVSPSPTPSPTPSGSGPSPEPGASPTPGGSADPSGTAGPEQSAAPSGSAGHSGGRPGGSGISIRIPSRSGGGSGASGAQKTTYTIAEQTLCTVTPQEKMLITVPVDELDVLSLSLGQTADLYLDALPTLGFAATVTEIDPEGENSGGNTKYAVTLALDRVPQLYPGMNGTVCFPRSEGRQVPAVPLTALEEDGSRTLIYTGYDPETDQLLSPVEVETGISDGTDVEILSGLTLGDAYYYRYADAISYVTK